MFVKCPECGKIYGHGTLSHCQNEGCQQVNAPLDCQRCGYVVSDDLEGVLDFEMNLIRYAEVEVTP
jgi:hypothetical protein